MRYSEAPVRARQAAFREWNSTRYANHPLNANAGVKFSIFSHRYIFILVFNRENGRDHLTKII